MLITFTAPEVNTRKTFIVDAYVDGLPIPSSSSFL